MGQVWLILLPNVFQVRMAWVGQDSRLLLTRLSRKVEAMAEAVRAAVGTEDSS